MVIVSTILHTVRVVLCRQRRIACPWRVPTRQNVPSVLTSTSIVKVFNVNALVHLSAKFQRGQNCIPGVPLSEMLTSVCRYRCEFLL